MLQRVQFAVLLQFAEHGSANLAATAAVVPGSGGRDFRLALENLLDEGSLEAPPARVESLVELAGGGWLRLTDLGRQRIAEDEV